MSSDPQSVRFQIASRLGGFRDTATIPDPFGTSAQFVIYRADGNAHRAWARAEMDRNPIVTEIMLGIESPPPALSSDDEKTVTTFRAKVEDDTARLLVPIIDRLTAATIERNLEREATKRALTDGRIQASDVMFQGMDQQLKEAKFILKDWSGVPADDGSTITFSSGMKEALLTNDTPLEGEEVQALLLKQDCWTYKRPLPDDEIDQADGSQEITDIKVGDDGARTSTTRTIHYKLTVLPSVTTLGRAYLLYFLAKSRETALFRNATMEAAGKNSAPSSDSIILSGDGTSGAETPN
jgi:hypothetical protein